MAVKSVPTKQDLANLKKLVELLRYFDSVTILGREVYQMDKPPLGKLWILDSEEKNAIRTLLNAANDCQ